MHSSKLRLIKGSIMLDVPGSLVRELRLRVGDTVEIGVQHDRTVIHKSARPHYTLDELIAQCDDSLTIDEEDRLWLDSRPVGNEIL